MSDLLKVMGGNSYVMSAETITGRSAPGDALASPGVLTKSNSHTGSFNIASGFISTGLEPDGVSVKMYHSVMKNLDASMQAQSDGGTPIVVAGLQFRF